MLPNHKFVISILAVSLLTIAALTLWSAASPSSRGELRVSIREWDVPTKGAHPHDPACSGLDKSESSIRVNTSPALFRNCYQGIDCCPLHSNPRRIS
jgi:hypothetical protein